MRKTVPAAAFISALLLLVVAGTQLVNLGRANPYMDYIKVPPPFKPTINILFPEENNTLHNLNKLRISFNTSVETAQIWTIYYKASWQREDITVYQYGHPNTLIIPNEPALAEYSTSLYLSEIPEGKQTVTITVDGEGGYAENMIYYSFSTVDSCTVGFTIDTIPPVVSVLELDNTTFVEPEFPLNFTVNESFSKISYVLDNQDNVTIDGNTTLTGLSNGVHNVTVYAWDAAGNTGASETICFTIAKEPEHFPTAIVATASGASVAVIGIGGLVYFRKRKR